jgi:phosphate transport system permease protein
MTRPSDKDLRVAAKLQRRHRAERRFRRLGLAAVSVGLAFLAVLFATIAGAGADAFRQTFMQVEVAIDTDGTEADGPPDAQALSRLDYQGLIKQAMRDAFPEARSRREKRELYALISPGAAFELRERVIADPGLAGRRATFWFAASDQVDLIVKGRVPRDAPAEVRKLSDRQMAWLGTLEDAGQVEARFNRTFFTAGDSREPELAGIAVATLGSLFSLMVCLAFAFPLGVMAAVYLEEFAPKTRWTEILEININNLAAVPSIVFGLLGLAVFLNVFQLPRSAPLVGGMVLALMTLPTIIIAGRAALQAVPPSIREGALAVGASPVQAVFHHVLPLAMPGVLTGTIIGTARALGETAPLLMVGMVAFVVDIPENILSPATALPVQIFLWADSPERAFEARTAAAIIVLLAFTCLMNLAAVLLRKRFEIRW